MTTTYLDRGQFHTARIPPPPPRTALRKQVPDCRTDVCACAHRLHIEQYSCPIPASWTKHRSLERAERVHSLDKLKMTRKIADSDTTPQLPKLLRFVSSKLHFLMVRTGKSSRMIKIEQHHGIRLNDCDGCTHSICVILF